MVATEAMLVARADLPTPLVHLLSDAARQLHSAQGCFEAQREFPHTDPLDLAVSDDARGYPRFGPNLLNRYLPFWAAALVERLIVIVLPLVNLLPKLLRRRVRSRIYRWYGELALLECEVAARGGELPIERWLADLNRIQRAVAKLRTPSWFASESYTLHEHIALMRQAVLAKAGTESLPPTVAARES